MNPVTFSLHFGGDTRRDIDTVLTQRRFYLAVAALAFFILGLAGLAFVVFVNVFIAS